jgi:hypothetical protein
MPQQCFGLAFATVAVGRRFSGVGGPDSHEHGAGVSGHAEPVAQPAEQPGRNFAVASPVAHWRRGYSPVASALGVCNC